MLTHIHLRNFVIVRELSIDFSTGLNVLTGETGAGKSIWVDAVGLALGNRVDGQVIRHNEERCDINLCFDLTDIPAATSWLREHEFDAEGECIIRRTINVNGTSRSTINGNPCPLTLLREFSELVLNIHGQHQSQSLLQRDSQRASLDTFAKNNDLLEKIGAHFYDWKKIANELDTLRAKAEQRDSELELLRFQHNELEHLNLDADEWDDLSKRHQQLHHSKDTMQQVGTALELLGDNDNASADQLIQQAVSALQSIKVTDTRLNEAQELLNSASVNCQEAINTLDHYRNAVDMSPEQLEEIERRLSLIHELARKHNTNPNTLHEVTADLAQQIEALENIETRVNELQRQLQTCEQAYEKHAKALTKRREKAAVQLSKKITEQMQLLGMPGGEFNVDLVATESPFTAHGSEKVVFLVSTNPGQTLAPLNKVVSGGELSRLSLALQVLTAEREGTPTLIFDEVDTGIGGKTAEIVGQLLRQLGDNAQVLCITHLPQVAAQGHHHYKVNKITEKNSTHTEMIALDRDQRIEELSRMLGGAKITAQTRAHAEELLV